MNRQNVQSRKVKGAPMLRADLIKNQRASRGETQSFLLSFLVNFSNQARLIHALIPLLKDRRDLFQTALRSYIVGLAGCLETFYRDLFVCVLDKDPAMLKEVLGQIKEKATLEEMHELMADGISFAEIATSKAVFQNIEEINRYLSILFPQVGYLEALSTYDFICSIPSRNQERASIKLHTTWKSEFSRVFALRHEFAHDANSKVLLEPAEVQKLEACVLLVPQLTTAMVSPQRNLKIVSTGTLPALLLVEDVIAEDWEIADDSSDVAKAALRLTPSGK